MISSPTITIVAMTPFDLSQPACREVVAVLSPFGPISIMTGIMHERIGIAVAIVRFRQRQRLAFSLLPGRAVCSYFTTSNRWRATTRSILRDSEIELAR